jgi:hypothetical protein
LLYIAESLGFCQNNDRKYKEVMRIISIFPPTSSFLLMGVVIPAVEQSETNTAGIQEREFALQIHMWIPDV